MAKRNIAALRGLVTGASGGIGAALTKELVARGAQIVAVARREHALSELAMELAAAPGRIVTVAGDLTQPDVRQRALDQAQVEFGGLDLLINNAGIGALGPFDQSQPDHLRRVMEVNFFATAEMTRTALPLLKQGRTPMVVNIASILGHRGIPYSTEYCASKFAVRGFSEALRAELEPRGIDVLVVSPGTTDTEFFDHVIRSTEAPYPKTYGVPASVVAQRTVRAIERGRHEIIVNPWGRLLIWANRLAPRLVDRFMARYGAGKDGGN